MSDNQTVNVEALEKSFNDSLSALSGILNTKVEELQKGKKEDIGKDEPKSSADIKGNEEGKKEDDEDEDEDEEDKAKKEGKMKKSLETFVEAEPEAKAALDVEPYLRTLVKGIDEKFEQVFNSIENLKKSSEENHNLSKSQSEVLLKFGELQKANSELQKSIKAEVQKIGDTPIPSGSVLRKGGDKFENDKAVDLGTKDQILEKAMKLCREQKLSNIDFTKIEGRLNKGMNLEENHIELIKGVK